MIDVWRRSGAEFALIVATLLAILILPIEQGVGIGIILSLLHGVWTTTRARTVEFERIPGTSIWWPATPWSAAKTCAGRARHRAAGAAFVPQRLRLPTGDQGAAASAARG